MLEGQPVVFLACSERFKHQVAVPVREALADCGVRGIIVSDEPLLPNTDSDPDKKVDSYLNSSEAVVALCTPDDELSDGTFQCRQNIVLEIQRALTRPGLSRRIQVLKTSGVKLPSDVNPTYDHLDVNELAPAIDAIVAQLRSWGVLARVPEQAPVPSMVPETVDDLIDGLELGDDDKTAQQAYAFLFDETRESQEVVVDRIVRFLRDNEDDDNTRVLLVGSFLEAISRFDPSLVSIEAVEELANSESFSIRATAAHLLWDWAEVAPDRVPLGLLGRLALPAGEDWYVQAPAMAAAKQLLLRRRAARIIFDSLARSEMTDNRYAVVVALADVAEFDRRAVPRNLVATLTGDQDELVARKAAEVLKVLGADAGPARDHLRPFGL